MMRQPKMQLSPGNYLTEAFRAEINAWMIDFFGYKEDPATTDATYRETPDNPPSLVKRRATAPRTKRATRTQAQPDMDTLSHLLDGIEDSFYTMQVPAITGSWLEKRHVNAIKKLGVYIPTPFGMDMGPNPAIPADVNRPAIASALLVPRKEDREEGKTYPRFMFCIKSARLPESVEMVQGTPYQFGMCYEMKRTESGKPMPPKLFWAWCWAVIKADGSIRIPHELRLVTSSVQHRRPTPGHKGQSGSRQSTVHSRRWVLPSLATAEPDRDQEGHEQFMKCAFRQLVVWWDKRKDQWSVGVRKDGHRVTFSIAKEHTAAYFADRETVVNVNGKPKKIVHFVRSHARSNGSEVKEHVRGLRVFNWKGYECTVVAPGLKGALFTDCPVDPVERERIEEGFISTNELAERLSSMEDEIMSVRAA